MGLFDGAVGSVAGSLIGGGLSFLGQSSANSANQQAAQTQMDFQERMSNTQYQRAVKDLEAAGLNPMMAYGNIHTSSPSGSLGVGAQNTMSQAGQQFGDAAGKGAETAFKMASIDNLHAQNKQIQATTGKEQALERQAIAQANNLDSATIKNEVDVLQGLAMTDYYKQLKSVPSAQAAHYLALTRGENFTNIGKAAESRMYERPGGEAIPYVKGVLPAVSSAVGGSVLGSMLGGKITFGRKPK